MVRLDENLEEVNSIRYIDAFSACKKEIFRPVSYILAGTADASPESEKQQHMYHSHHHHHHHQHKQTPHHKESHPPPPSSASDISHFVSSAPPSDQNLSQNVYIVDKKNRITYLKGKLIGKGGFAKCYKLTDLTTNNTFAGKIISKSLLTRPQQRDKIMKEIEIHSNLNHKNIVQFHHSFEDNSNIYIILEYCSKKTLVHYLKHKGRVSESEVRFVMRQILDCLIYLHSKGVIHRDIKLGNLFLTDNFTVKIGDFGLATRTNDKNRKDSICGTPNYIAPEVLMKLGHGYSADIWALGCTMFALLFGKPPFETSSLKETYFRITNNIYTCGQDISSFAQKLIKDLLHPNPSHRPTLSQIMAYPFFDYFSKSHVPDAFVLPAKPIPNQINALLHASTAKSKGEEVADLREKNYISSNIQKYRISTSSNLAKLKAKLNAEVVESDTPSSRVEARSSLHPKESAELRDGVGDQVSCPKVLKDQSRLKCRTSKFLCVELPGKKSKLCPKIKNKFLKIIQSHCRSKSTPSISSCVTEKEVGSQETKDLRLHQSPAVLSDAEPLDKRIHRFSSIKSVCDKSESSSGHQSAQSSCNTYTTFESMYQFISHLLKTTVSSTTTTNNNNYKDAQSEFYSKYAQYTDLDKRRSTPDTSFHPTKIVNRKSMMAAKEEDVGRNIWVVKWVDYSNKWGFGYKLSNNSYGVLFTDGYRYHLASDGNTITMMNPMTRSMKTFTKADVPWDLVRKTLLLFYFVKFMNENLIEGGKLPQNQSTTKSFSSCNLSASKKSSDSGHSEIEPCIHVNHWFYKEKALVMSFSNATLQINFLFDHTKLILASHQNNNNLQLSYVNEHRFMSTYSAQHLQAQPILTAKLKSKLKFAKHALKDLLNM